MKAVSVAPPAVGCFGRPSGPSAITAFQHLCERIPLRYRPDRCNASAVAGRWVFRSCQRTRVAKAAAPPEHTPPLPPSHLPLPAGAQEHQVLPPAATQPEHPPLLLLLLPPAGAQEHQVLPVHRAGLGGGGTAGEGGGGEGEGRVSASMSLQAGQRA